VFSLIIIFIIDKKTLYVFENLKNIKYNCKNWN